MLLPFSFDELTVLNVQKTRLENLYSNLEYISQSFLN